MNKILITFSGVLLVWSPIELINNSVSAKTATTATRIVKNSSQMNKKVKSAKNKNVSKKKKISAKKSKIKRKIAKKVQKRKKYNKNAIKLYAHNLVLKYGWSEYDYECLVKLWNRESSWNPYAVNKKSGACGIAQSLPCKKMRSFGKDYKTNYKTQIKWGLNYIKNRYGTPANAWNHSQRKGWY